MRCRLLFSVAFILFISCEDIERSNPLDPKNEESSTRSVILIEAFVNTAHPSAYNLWALQGLDKIKQDLADKVEVVQYHRDLPGYDDPHNTTELDDIFTQLQQKYVELLKDPPRSVPDIYVNGTSHRVNGASSADAVYDRMIENIINFSDQTNHFLIQPEFTMTGNQISVTCRIARLGNQQERNLKIKLLFIQRGQNHPKKNVVTAIYNSTEIDQISAGSYWDGSLGVFAFPEFPDAAIISVTSRDDLVTYQSIKVGL